MTIAVDLGRKATKQTKVYLYITVNGNMNKYVKTNIFKASLYGIFRFLQPFKPYEQRKYDRQLTKRTCMWLALSREFVR